MAGDGILPAAIDQIEREQSILRAEREAFADFREIVRLVTPDSQDADNSETAAELRAAYREQVMEALDYEAKYGDSLGESLEEEFDRAIADALLSEKPITQQRKHALLVRTAVAIESREQFLEELSAESDALESFASELETVHATIDKLPLCSSTVLHLEKLLVVWEVYDELERRCERLLERRQAQIRDAERSVRVFGGKHALCEYLYRDLESQYPVLSIIASAVEQIDANRSDDGSTERSSEI